MNQHLGKNYYSFFLIDIMKYKVLSEVIMVTHFYATEAIKAVHLEQGVGQICQIVVHSSK